MFNFVLISIVILYINLTSKLIFKEKWIVRKPHNCTKEEKFSLFSFRAFVLLGNVKYTSYCNGHFVS